MKYLQNFASVACFVLLLPFSAAQLPIKPSPDALAEPRRLIDSGHLSESESLLRSYLAEHPTSAEAHFLLGYLLFREQKPTESLAEYTAGAKTQRPNAADLKTVASDYVLLDDFEDADKWFSAIAQETPNDAAIWYLLGRTRYNEGRFDESIACFTKAISLRDKYVEAENNLGLALHELNKSDEAKEAFRTAIIWQGASPTDAQPFLNLGIILAEQGDLESAIINLKQAVTLSPNNPSIHEQLGSAFEGRDALMEAKTELEQAIALAPDISSLHFKLAGIYKKLGLKDEAKKELEICARLNSTHSSHKTPNPMLSK